MTYLSFENVVKEILNKFPEYKDTECYENNDKELQYSFFFGFTEYVNQLIQKSSNPISEPEIKKAFDLFNEMVSSKEENLSTLVVVEVLENLVQNKKSKDVALHLLNEDGLKHIKEVLKFTGIEE